MDCFVLPADHHPIRSKPAQSFGGVLIEHSGPLWHRSLYWLQTESRILDGNVPKDFGLVSQQGFDHLPRFLPCLIVRTGPGIMELRAYVREMARGLAVVATVITYIRVRQADAMQVRLGGVDVCNHLHPDPLFRSRETMDGKLDILNLLAACHEPGKRRCRWQMEFHHPAIHGILDEELECCRGVHPQLQRRLLGIVPPSLLSVLWRLAGAPGI
mmetsp:Transcript_32414/g.67008  ORF Transcript_32414/g.67008 Transcript_32414/m.67008 type:complete len:214 (+) Transcript_32414:221-862(+)